MSGGNDGTSTQNWSYPRVAGHDKIHFSLGTSSARPAAGYFASVAGLSNEQEIVALIAGLSNEVEIERLYISCSTTIDRRLVTI
jgi:hypothetical protein